MRNSVERCLSGEGNAMRSFSVVAILLFATLPMTAGNMLDVGDVVVSQADTSPIVRFTVMTAKGYVGFSVPKDWRVLSLQSKPPVAAAAFLAPNSADEGTPDSTNIAISLIQSEADQGKSALNRVGKSYEGDVETSSRSGWECYAQSAHQKKTIYTILDAKKSVADVTVSVRVAWPHLPKNSPSYDSDMKALFGTLLDAIDGNLGSYQIKPGEVVRRPDK
jgi:hypothetical protein